MLPLNRDVNMPYILLGWQRYKEEMSDENTFVGFTNFQRNTFFAFIPAVIFTCSKLTTEKKDNV